MQGQKSQHANPAGGGWFKRELKFLGIFLGLISFSNIIISSNTFALFVPTLSASVDQANLQVNGNQVINSTDQTTEIPLNLIVNTNNKTGYTATLNTETNETALVNSNSPTNAKINSIASASALTGFLSNTWGVKFGSSTTFLPIPASSSPVQILQTTGKTSGNEPSQLNIGMKLSGNLESGSYKNKLIFSILTNSYNPIALMTTGPNFNTKLKSLETATNKIEHFKKSPMPPVVYMDTVTIDDPESDYEIKLWLDPTDKTAYYYAAQEKVYLNEDSSNMFARDSSGNGIENIRDLDLSGFNTSKVTNMNSMFSSMSSLTSLDLSNFDTSKVTNMTDMFSYMFNLTSLNLSNFDTSNVTNMRGMFYHASNLTSLNLSNFDTSNVTDMGYMFTYMSSVTSLNLSSFNTSNVTNMSGMFSQIPYLPSLDLSHFDTSRVTDMSYMFSFLDGVSSLDLSNFNTSNVTNMASMFSWMSGLTSLNLSNFDTSKVTNMTGMFALSSSVASSDKLQTIYVKDDFDTTKLQSYIDMFINRKKLRGGAGSYLADPSTADKSWLRIDDPINGRPGYFTRKP